MMTLADALDLYGYNAKNRRSLVPFMVRRSKNKDQLYTKCTLNALKGPKGLSKLPVIKVTEEESDFKPFITYKKRENGIIKVFWVDDSNYYPEYNYSSCGKRKKNIIKENPDDYIYQCLKRYGNTVIGKVHFYRIFKRIWHENISKHIPADAMINSKYSEQREQCMDIIKENIKQKIGERVMIRRVISFEKPDVYTKCNEEVSEFFIVEVISELQKCS